MKLFRFMNEAYPEKGRRLKRHQGDMVFSLEDLASRVGTRPSRAEVEELICRDETVLGQLLWADPGKEYRLLWGYLSSIAAERSSEPLLLPSRDYAGLELSHGTIILQGASDHVGEKMSGGKIMARQGSGDYLGQEMTGGVIITRQAGDYAFRNMRGGKGLVQGDCGKFLGLGNWGGKIVILGSCLERAGWLMRGGSIRVRGEAGEYLGLLMKGGQIVVLGRAGKRAGWRRRGGTIKAIEFGAEACDGINELD